MLYNLLRDFPSDSYAILTSYYNIDNISAVKGTWLSGEYIFYDNSTGSIEARKRSGGEGEQKIDLVQYVQKLKLLMKKVKPIRALAGFPVIFSQIFAIVKSGRKAVTGTGTEILLGISDYGPAMIGSYFLHKITKRPLYLFMFDLYKGNFFPFPGGLLAAIFEKRIFLSATKIIVNNEGTKDFYHKKYGDIISRKITIIHNSVFPEAYENLKQIETIKDKKPPYIILFTGRVSWPQEGAIKNLIKAVNEMEDTDVEFRFYTPMPKDHLKSIGIVESEKMKISFAPPQDMPKIQNEADILFLPLSWNTQSQVIIDTATPGKLTDYLMAGKPILVHAPASSYLVKYAKENNFAAVVDEEDTEKLKEVIKKLLTDKELSKKLVENAQKTFFKNHNVKINAQKFAEIFQK